jgi:hypothetical protein
MPVAFDSDVLSLALNPSPRPRHLPPISLDTRYPGLYMMAA